MPYSPDKPRLTETSEELRARIPDWAPTWTRTTARRC